jgi:hypothetical protein
VQNKISSKNPLTRNCRNKQIENKLTQYESCFVRNKHRFIALVSQGQNKIYFKPPCFYLFAEMKNPSTLISDEKTKRLMFFI